MDTYASLRRFVAVLVGIAPGCGGSQPAVQHAPAELSDGTGTPPEDDGLSISGLRGTLSTLEIQGALEPRLPKLSRCAAKRTSEVEWLGGELEFGFNVAVDGSVIRVYPTRSTLGDRETERCMLDVARATHFPRPHGGEADFTWSVEIPANPDVRPPDRWEAPELDQLRTSVVPQLAEQCSPAPLEVTLYVDVDGRVVSAGAASPSGEADDALDCVTSLLQSLSFPTPGSYVASVQWSFP